MNSNGKTPQNQAPSESDWTRLLTALEVLTERQTKIDSEYRSLRNIIDGDYKALQNVLEAVVEKLETIEETIEETVEETIEKRVERLENSVQKAVSREIQDLRGQLGKLAEKRSRELELTQNAILNELGRYNRNCVATWRETDSDRKNLREWLDGKIVIEPRTALKWGGAMLGLTSLLTWILVSLFPPNAGQIQTIKGKLNNLEIKVNRLKNEPLPKPIRR